MNYSQIHDLRGKPVPRNILFEPACVLSLVLTLVAFLIDSTTPHGVADGFLYILPVLACFWVSAVSAALYAAMALMIPLGLGILISPHGASMWIEVTNRLLGAATIWLTALLISHNARLTKQREHLLARIRELNQVAEHFKYGTQVSVSRWLHASLSHKLSAAGWCLDRIAHDEVREEQVRMVVNEAREVIDATIISAHDEEDKLRVPVEPAELAWFVRRHIYDFRCQTAIPVIVKGVLNLTVAWGTRAALCSDFVKEALTNVAKHARASRVMVEFREDSRGAYVAIEDDGRGVAPGIQSTRGLGLFRLQEQLRTIGGTFSLSRIAPHGVRVEAWVPPDTPGKAFEV